MDELLRAPTVYFTIGPIEINETVVSFWVIAAILVIGSILLTRKFSWLPKGRQNLAEMLVEGLSNFVAFVMGEQNRYFTPFIGTLILFILLANTTGIWSFGLLRPPTADVNMTLALGLISFFTIQGYAIKSKGLGAYLKGFFEPFFLFLPMNLFGELSKPISLGFRLFGNIFGGLVIIGMVYQRMGFLLPVPLHFYFDLFSGILQTAVFSMLTMVFITLAME
jgi:F-type H+-transporting ATPase subunit a